MLNDINNIYRLLFALRVHDRAVVPGHILQKIDEDVGKK